MTREEEYQKAAHEYINSDAVKPENMQMAYGDFINGAKWADEHPKNPWVSIEERLPKKAIGLYELEKDEQYKMVLFKTANGKLFRGFLDAEEIWRAFTVFKGACPIDSLTWSRVTHWMPIPSAKGGEQ